MTYGPIVVDDSSGMFEVTSLGAPATVAAQIVKDLTPTVVVVPPPVVTPPPVVVPPPVVTPPASGSIAWATIPHVLNDWSVAGEVTFGAHQYYTESSMKLYAAQLSTNTTTPIYRGEVRNNELWTEDDGGNDTERAELDGSVTLYPKGTEIWASYQFMVEPGLPMVAGVVKPTGDTKSTMTCWVDGVQVATSTGIVIGGADAHNYVKAGIYRGWQGDGYSPLAVQVANLEHGTASLMARVAAPLPWPTVK